LRFEFLRLESAMSLISFKIPQAYLDLGVPFFMGLSAESEQALKQHLLRETRRLHPDLLALDASDEAREQHESQLAALNAAYLKLRDEDSRLDLVLDQIVADNPALEQGKKPEIPTALAMEYFELQEALEETPGDTATLAALESFHSALEIETQKLAQEVSELLGAASCKASEGSEASLVSMPLACVVHLKDLRNRQRYLMRLLDDVSRLRLKI
jgi:curved DNA-binding protein CbpA